LLEGLNVGDGQTNGQKWEVSVNPKLKPKLKFQVSNGGNDDPSQHDRHAGIAAITVTSSDLLWFIILSNLSNPLTIVAKHP
jgi:hypothetical protein